jgi:hypothetical protein
LEKAKALDVSIINEDEFLRMIGEEQTTKPSSRATIQGTLF